MVETRRQRKNSTVDNEDNGNHYESQSSPVPDAPVTPTRKSPRTRNKSRSLSEESWVLVEAETQEDNGTKEELSTPKRAARSPTRNTRSKSPTPTTRRTRSKSPAREARSKSPTRSTTTTPRTRSKSPTRKKGSESANTGAEEKDALKETTEKTTVEEPDTATAETEVAVAKEVPETSTEEKEKETTETTTVEEPATATAEPEVAAVKKVPETADNDDLLVIQDSEPDDNSQELGKGQNNQEEVNELQKNGAKEDDLPKVKESETNDQKDTDSILPTVDDNDKAKGSANKVTTPKQSSRPAISKVASISATKSDSKRKKKAPKNELTSFIPGYTAKLQLDSSSLKSQRPGLDALRRRALVTDRATAPFVKGTLANQKRTQGVLAAGTKTSSAIAAPGGGKIVKSSFKHGTKREAPNNAGDGWFGMVPTPMTEDVKRDLKVIRYRNYLDPKRFYKSSDTASKFVQVGTVVEGTSEFYSSRLTKKERRSNLTEELMADPATAGYTKRKFQNMQQEKVRKRQKMSKKRKNNGKKSHA